MKLVLAIINHDDAHVVVHNLTKEGFLVTKLSTTGGFLMVGNMTVLIGVPLLQEPQAGHAQHVRDRHGNVPDDARRSYRRRRDHLRPRRRSL